MASVKMLNVAPDADEPAIRDFFQFCGEVDQIEFIPLAEAGELPKGLKEDSEVAIVRFAAADSVITAQLLSDSLLVDRPVTIVPLEDERATKLIGATSSSGQGVEKKGSASSRSTGGQPDSKHKRDAASSEEKQAESAENIAGAESDETDGVRNHRDSGAEGAKDLSLLDSMKQKAQGVHSQVKLYDEAHGISATVTGKLKTLQEEHKISEKVSAAKERATEAAQKVMANESVKKGFSFMQSGFAALKKVAVQAEEYNRKFSEKLLQEARNEQQRAQAQAQTSNLRQAEPSEDQSSSELGKDSQALGVEPKPVVGASGA